MASWSRVVPTDTLRLLDVLDMVHANALSMNYPMSLGFDKFFAVGSINTGVVEAVWIEDHTLLIYAVERWAWHSPNLSCLSELLLYKYKQTAGATFKSVLSVLDELAADCGCSAVSVGNSLSPQPERLMLLYERAGYVPHANILIKERHE